MLRWMLPGGGVPQVDVPDPVAEQVDELPGSAPEATTWLKSITTPTPVPVSRSVSCRARSRVWHSRRMCSDSTHSCRSWAAAPVRGHGQLVGDPGDVGGFVDDRVWASAPFGSTSARPFTAAVRSSSRSRCSDRSARWVSSRTAFRSPTSPFTDRTRSPEAVTSAATWVDRDPVRARRARGRTPPATRPGRSRRSPSSAMTARAVGQHQVAETDGGTTEPVTDAHGLTTLSARACTGPTYVGAPVR